VKNNNKSTRCLFVRPSERRLIEEKRKNAHLQKSVEKKNPKALHYLVIRKNVLPCRRICGAGEGGGGGRGEGFAQQGAGL